MGLGSPCALSQNGSQGPSTAFVHDASIREGTTQQERFETFAPTMVRTPDSGMAFAYINVTEGMQCGTGQEK